MMETYIKTMRGEWEDLLGQTDLHIRHIAAELGKVHAHELSIAFYRIVLADAHAEEFLSNEQVEKTAQACPRTMGC